MSLGRIIADHESAAWPILSSLQEDFRMRTLLTASIVGLTACGMAAAADLQSGLQVGDHAGYFEVKDVTGPAAGQSLCYR